MTQANPIASSFIRAARECLAEGMSKIEHCVAQLDQDQVWWRARPETNSIANLLLHLSGNVRQWIISGLGGAPDVRNRPAEFAQRGGEPAEGLLERLRTTVAQADRVLAELSADQLAQSRRIQGFDTSVLQAAFDTLAHFRGHVQEIISLTRQQLGPRYRFHWVPSGPEQVSAHPAP